MEKALAEVASGVSIRNVGSEIWNERRYFAFSFKEDKGW